MRDGDSIFKTFKKSKSILTINYMFMLEKKNKNILNKYSNKAYTKYIYQLLEIRFGKWLQDFDLECKWEEEVQKQPKREESFIYLYHYYFPNKILSFT